MDNKTWIKIFVVVIPTSIAGGYKLGSDHADVNVEALEEIIESEKITNDIDTTTLLRRLDAISDTIGEKEALQAQINQLQVNESSLLKEISKTEDNAIEIEEQLASSQHEVERLNLLISQDFEELGEIKVDKNSSRALIPGKVFIGYSKTFLASAWLTVTGSITDQEVQIGQKVEFKDEEQDCFLVLTGITSDSIIVTYACPK